MRLAAFLPAEPTGMQLTVLLNGAAWPRNGYFTLGGTSQTACNFRTLPEEDSRSKSCEFDPPCKGMTAKQAFPGPLQSLPWH